MWWIWNILVGLSKERLGWQWLRWWWRRRSAVWYVLRTTLRTEEYHRHYADNFAWWIIFDENVCIIDWLLWRHNGRDGVSNHQPRDCLLNPSFRRRSKKTSKLRVPGLCAGNSPVTGEFPAQKASDAENVSSWWRHHVMNYLWRKCLYYWFIDGWVLFPVTS